MTKKILKYGIIIFIIPLIIFMSFALLEKRAYPLVSIVVIILSCVSFFLSFEKKNASSRYIVILAVMTALSVAGRFIFAPLPFFKPVTAMVIISAMYFGSEFGFITGALSAVLSNFYFGQGPWTPFQIFSWGIIGFVAGLLSNQLMRSKLILISFGFFAGVAYSLIMDVWTTLWADGTFNPERFIGAVISALPITAIYAVSNIIFLLILTPLLGKKIIRIKTKYGL